MTYMRWRRGLAVSESRALLDQARATGTIDRLTYGTPALDVYIASLNPRKKRWPFANLVAACSHVTVNSKPIGETGQVAHVTGRSKTTVLRWAKEGVPTDAADEVAVAMGLHPVDIWPDWFEFWELVDPGDGEAA